MAVNVDFLRANGVSEEEIQRLLEEERRSTQPPAPTSTGPVIVNLTGDDPEVPTPPAPTGVNRPISSVQSGQDFRVDLRNYLESYYEKLEEDLGLSKFTLGTFVEQNWETVIDQMEWATSNDIDRWLRGDHAKFLEANDTDPVLFVHKQPYVDGKLNPNSLQGLHTLQAWATQIMDGFLGIDSNSLLNRPTSTGTTRRTGPTKPTPQQLRDQFDVNALASNVKDIWRAYMAEEPPKGGMALAKAYVEEIVKTGGEKQIDFREYVLGHARKTSRWGVLYTHKQEGMDELKHMAPYIAAAQQAIMGSGDENRFSQLVLEGAGLGASASDFAGKLQREDPIRESSGFISGLENTVSSIKGILRG